MPPCTAPVHRLGKLHQSPPAWHGMAWQANSKPSFAGPRSASPSVYPFLPPLRQAASPCVSHDCAVSRCSLTSLALLASQPPPLHVQPEESTFTMGIVIYTDRVNVVVVRFSYSCSFRTNPPRNPRKLATPGF